MFDHSNTPGAVRAEDQPLIEAINDARRRYGFSDAAATQLLNAFTTPELGLKMLIFDLCDPSPRASPFVTDDHLAAFTRDVGTRGRDYSARWSDLRAKERRLARRIKRFAQDKRRVWMGAGRPQNVDRALVLYVIRLIEEVTGVEFRFSRPAPLFSLGGPMLRLAEAALLRLLRMFDGKAGSLGLISPARYYTPKEIAQTAEWARRARKTSPESPANWSSDLILAFPGDVRSELVGKARQENKDQGSASPSSWDIVRETLKRLVANPWVNPREALDLVAAAGERQTPSGLDVLQDNLKSGAQPDLIELAKRKSLVSPMCLLVEIIRAVAAERILPDEPPASPPPSTGA